MSDVIEFDNLTEQEIQEYNLIPDGKYVAEVFDAFSKDKNGNRLLTGTGVQKFDVIFSLYDAEGRKRPLKSTLTPAFMKLWKHFFDATGQQEIYNTRKASLDNILNTKSRFIISVGKRTYKNQSNEDVTVNNVLDFLPMKKDSINNEILDFDDSIPF